MPLLDLSDWLIVIPARLRSERLPNKPLQSLGGRPLIEQVYLNLMPMAASGAKIIVAVDDPKVAAACGAAHVPHVMTQVSHQSGTDRCHEVSQMFEHKYLLNVQGDEPFMNIDDLKSLMLTLSGSSSPMATLAIKTRGTSQFLNPNIVKVVRGEHGRAIYFSRAPVPYDRDVLKLKSSPESELEFWQHQGVYAFTRGGLEDFCKLPASRLEQIEKLEQLRAIEAGWSILIAEASHRSIGIDTPEDLVRAEALWQERQTRPHL